MRRTTPSRRDLLRYALAGTGIAALGPVGRGLSRAHAGNASTKRLVVVHLDGGLDGPSLLVPRTGEVVPWQRGGFAALTAADFEQIAALSPEVVIFGSGARLRFVRPALLRALIERGIGVETMDTAAACRTYNVLAAERRAVLAALLLGAG